MNRKRSNGPTPTEKKKRIKCKLKGISKQCLI